MSRTGRAGSRSWLPPWGTTVWLPEDCRRLRRCEDALRRIFVRVGAAEIATPAFEFAHTLEQTFGNSDRLFRFLDADGTPLALRPELTTSAARLFATSLADRKLPLKLFYIGQVFRQEQKHRGRLREYRQAGFEYYGGRPGDADGETIAVALKAISAVSRKEAILEIGDVSLVRTLLDETRLSGPRREALEDALERKDRQALKDLRAPTAVTRLLEIGMDENSIKLAASLSKSDRYRKSISQVRATVRALRKSGFRGKIVFEPAAVRKIEYYTGIVFAAYLPDMGRAVLTGGRYDNLVARFGVPVPATGFSLELERLLRR